MLASLVALTACSSGAPSLQREPETTSIAEAELTAPTTSNSAEFVPSATQPAGPGLVLVLDVDGGPEALTVRSTDGDLVVALSTEATDSYWSPIWSPDADRVGWAQSSDESWSFVTTNVDGTDRQSFGLPARPDYLTFGTSSDVILALTLAQNGFGLHRMELDSISALADSPLELVDAGRPYYAALSPAGDQVIAHVGGSTRIVDLDTGGLRDLDDSGFSYQTPAWHPSENKVFYARTTEVGREIVMDDLDDATSTIIATFGTFAFLAVSPDGNHLAISTFDADADGQTETVALGDSPAHLSDGLWVIDLQTGEATRLLGEVTVGVAWNAQSTKLLTRTAVAGPGFWRVFGLDGSTNGTDEHEITPGGLSSFYLQFWDQFLQSQTVWSPDGTQFLYSASTNSGADAIFIQSANENGNPTLLAPGDIAFFSPLPNGVS